MRGDGLGCAEQQGACVVGSVERGEQEGSVVEPEGWLAGEVFELGHAGEEVFGALESWRD